MKKMCKKFAIVLAAVLFVCGIANVNPATADAKAGLNKKKLSLYVGNTYKLKVKGTKKKVKWSSTKKKVASVTKKGVVTAKKAGSAVITAKTGSKKYKCKVTVRGVAPIVNVPSVPTATTTPPTGNVSTVSNSVLAANLSVSVEPIQNSSYAVFSITNNNTQAVPYYKVNYQFKNAESAVVDTGSFTGYVIAPGQTQYRTEYIGEKYIPMIDVSQSIMSVTVNTSLNYVDASSVVTITDSKTVDGDISLTYYNADTGNVSVSTNILFYDAQGNLVDARWEYCSLTSGKTEFETVSAPYEYNEDFEKVSTYSTYKIYNYAYKY